jgi:hypothetical protein
MKTKSSNIKPTPPATETSGSGVTWQERMQKSDPISEEDQGRLAFQLLSLEILQKFLTEGVTAYEPIKLEDTSYPEAPTIHWQPSGLLLKKLGEHGLDDPELLAITMNSITGHIHHILHQSYDGKVDEDFKLVLASLDESDGQLKFSLHFPKALDPREVLQKLKSPKVAKCLEDAIKKDFQQTAVCADLYAAFGHKNGGYSFG